MYYRNLRYTGVSSIGESLPSPSDKQNVDCSGCGFYRAAHFPNSFYIIPFHNLRKTEKSLKILTFSTRRGAVPITQKNPTIDIRLFTGTSAFSVLLVDGVFSYENGTVLDEEAIEELKPLVLEFDYQGEEEYTITKQALGLS